MSPGERSRMVVAIAINLAVGQAVALTLGLPRWTGTVAAAGAMTAASMPDNLPVLARGAVEIAVLPGNLVAQLLEDQANKLDEPESENNA